MKKIISLALVWGLVLFLLAPLGYAEGEEGGEIPDEPEITGYIEVIKTVSNAFTGMPDRDFGFIIRLSDPVLPEKRSESEIFLYFKWSPLSDT